MIRLNTRIWLCPIRAPPHAQAARDNQQIAPNRMVKTAIPVVRSSSGSTKVESDENTASQAFGLSP